MALLLALFVALSASAAPHISEERCFDIKQSVLADLPQFCAAAKVDKARLADFGRQIELIEKSCGQPQLSMLLRKAVDRRLSGQRTAGCVAKTEMTAAAAEKI